MSKGTQHQQPKLSINELIEKYQQTKSEEIQTQLVKHYEGLVCALASKFSKGTSSDEDLIQVGMVGLLAAIRRFDTEFGRGFESYAIPTIIGEIKRYIRD